MILIYSPWLCWFGAYCDSEHPCGREGADREETSAQACLPPSDPTSSLYAPPPNTMPLSEGQACYTTVNVTVWTWSLMNSTACIPFRSRRHQSRSITKNLPGPVRRRPNSETLMICLPKGLQLTSLLPQEIQEWPYLPQFLSFDLTSDPPLTPAPIWQLLLGWPHLWPLPGLVFSLAAPGWFLILWQL